MRVHTPPWQPQPHCGSEQISYRCTESTAPPTKTRCRLNPPPGPQNALLSSPAHYWVQRNLRCTVPVTHSTRRCSNPHQPSCQPGHRERGSPATTSKREVVPHQRLRSAIAGHHHIYSLVRRSLQRLGQEPVDAGGGNLRNLGGRAANGDGARSLGVKVGPADLVRGLSERRRGCAVGVDLVHQHRTTLRRGILRLVDDQPARVPVQAVLLHGHEDATGPGRQP